MARFLGGMVLIAAMVGVPACGGSSSGGSGNSDAGVGTPLTDAPAALAGALCGVLTQCLGPVETLALQGQDCSTYYTAQLKEGEISLFPAAITKGTVVYDGTKMSACLGAIQSAGCATLTTRLSSLCGSLAKGIIPSGGACSLSSECASGSFCKTASVCPGTCTALLSAGQDCEQSDDCENGLICSTTTNKCVKPADAGEACNGSAPPCSPELACQGAPQGGSGTCVTIAAAFGAASGAACDPTTATFCATGLSCAATAVTGGTVAFTCEAPPATTACHIGYPEECPQGQYCLLATASLTGACSVLPGNGAACAKHSPSDKTSTDRLCAPGTVCDTTSTTCRTLGELGTTCAADNECISNVCASGGCAPAVCAATE